MCCTLAEWSSHICICCVLLPVGGTAASVPTTGRVAAHLCQLDAERWRVEGLPRGKVEGKGRGTGCLASDQTGRSSHSGTGTGEMYCMFVQIGEWRNQ